MTTVLPRSQRTLVLALLCVASFAVVFNNLIITPILPDIARDFEVRVAVAGLLVTAYAIVGGTAAIFAGPVIDRLGRKPVVVVGMSLLTVATLLSAIAPGYYLLMASRAMAGLGVACLTPAVFAAVGDYFEYHERGRAMSWVITANTSASILGVPAGALISGLLSWRLTFALLAGLCVIFTWLLFRKLPPDSRNASQVAGLGTLKIVLGKLSTTMAIASTFLWTACWFVFITYMGAYFHDEFGLANWALGGLTMLMGLGVLVGSNVGGRMGDRVGNRRVIVFTSCVCCVLIFLETTVATALVPAAVLFFFFATSGGARFASQQAVLTELEPNLRGTVMALAAAGQQFGIVAGSALGGLVLTIWGYTGLGPASSVLALFSMLAFALFVQERRPERVPQPETQPATAG